MKKVLLSLIFCLCAIITYAQDASYTYKPLAKEGCHVEYSALKQDNKSYIIVSVRSDEGLCFVNDPVMRLRTGNNDVIKLTGTNMGTRKESSSGFCHVRFFTYLSVANKNIDNIGESVPL